MKPAEVITKWKAEPLVRRSITADLLGYLAEHVVEARLDSGGRVLDASDFRQWLLDLAEEADRVAA